MKFHQSQKHHDCHKPEPELPDIGSPSHSKFLPLPRSSVTTLTMASNYLSSTETTNFARLCRLVVDISSDLLRDVIDARIPPPGLTSFLNSQKHQLCKHLKPFQRRVVYPSDATCVGTLQGLDFSLLYTLARNLGGINIPAHNKGWGKDPDTADRSISANIERLRVQRNEAYGHLPSASLPESDFKSRWDLIRQSVLEIENAALSGDKYVRAMDNLLTMVMDPEAENNYIEELEKLRKEDLEVKDILKDVKDDVAAVKVTLDEISTDTRDVIAKQEVMTANIIATARDVTDLKARQEDMATALTREIQHPQEIHADLRPMIEQTKAMINQEKKEKKFYSTKSFCDAKEKLRQNKVVVIKGNTGDGKTAIAVQLLHELSQDQQAGQLLPLKIHNMEKLDLLTTKSKCITFIDDIFGEKDVCKKDINEWNKRLSNIKSLFANVDASNFLIITLRNEVFNSLGKGFCETIFTESNIIDLSIDTYKVEEEKRALLNLYKPENFSWTEKEIENILTCAPNIGFPQCCQLFYNSPNLQKEGSRFFEKPFQFLNEALHKLPECSALLYLFLNDGFVRVKDLDPNGQNVNKKLLEEAFDISLISGHDDSTKFSYKKKVTFVKENLKKLLGFLVMTRKRWSGEDVYRFHHDSIFVAVALLYGKATPVGYIQNCPSKCLSYLTTSKTATNMIVISSDHYTDMCERLLREFECKKWRYETSVGSLDVWKDPVFVKRFVGLLNERKVDKLAVLNGACKFGAEECALYLLSEGVKPDKYTDLKSLVLRKLSEENDGNKQLCLLKKIVVYMNDKTKLDVLNRACDNGAEECVLYLLSKSVKPNKDTALSLVCRHWNDGNKQLCLLKKIVVYMNDKTKLDVLNTAFQSGAEECVLYLLSEGVKPDNYTALPLVDRHWNGGNKPLCFLKEIVVYLNDQQKLVVLNGACQSGAEKCILYLLSKGVKPNKDTALSLVGSHWNDGNKQLCLLKEIVVYLNDQAKLAMLNRACQSGAEECALYLLCEERVKPDEDTVFRVAEGRSIKVLRKLLEYDVKPTARGGGNDNVIHVACWWGREKIVKYLCDTDVLGQTLLHRRARNGNVGLFQTMERIVLNSLCRVENQQTKCESVDGCVVHKYCVCAQYMSQLVDRYGGRTVLHWSCGSWYGGLNREVCLYLCRSYPGLTTIVDKLGWHCLHYIAYYTSDVDVFAECETYVKQYVESTGCKYDVTTILDNDGRTVLHWSCGGGLFQSRKGNREVRLYLCRSYPGLTTIVDKYGQHCLHLIAWHTSDVDVFTECETYVKQYVESTGCKYDVTTILDCYGRSVLDRARERAKIDKNNHLLEHLVEVFSQ